MKQSKKPNKLVAACFIVAGLLLAGAGLAFGAKISIISTDDGFRAVSGEDLQRDEVQLQKFSNIDINLKDADIEILPSAQFKIEVERLESTNLTHIVKDDTLYIEEENSKLSFFMMNFTFVNHSAKVKVYVPDTLEDIKINNDFGDLKLGGVESNTILLSVKDGDLEVYDIQSQQLAITNSYGDITGSDLKADRIDLQLNDGNVNLKSVIAASTAVKNKYGDTSLTDYTSQEMHLENTDGDIQVTGELLGNSAIHSSYGNIQLALVNKQSDLNYEIENSFGDIFINDQRFVDKASNQTNSEHHMKVISKDGDIELKLK